MSEYWSKLSRTQLGEISDEELKGHIQKVWEHSAGNLRHDAVLSALISEQNRRSAKKLEEASAAETKRVAADADQRAGTAERLAKSALYVSAIATLGTLAQVVLQLIQMKWGG